MLAYVLWHRPAPGSDPAAYADALRALHAALAARPLAGLLGGASFAIDPPPWLPGEGDAWEDWWLVEGWDAVGRLEAGVLEGRRRGPHDAIAARSGPGAGAVYGHVAGTGSAAGARGRWSAEDPGPPAPGGSVWRRRLVLGPAPQWVALGDAAGTSPSAAVVDLGRRAL